MKFVRSLPSYIVLLLALMFLGSVILLTTGLLPQKRIEKNVLNSMYQLESEGNYPHILDKENWACMLDMYTDYHILDLSYYMNTAKDPATVFTNPEQFGGNAQGWHAAIDQHSEPNETYPRYWGGFRATGRLLLTFFTYTQIRRIISIVFMLLAGGTALYLYKRTNSLVIALSFLLTLGLLNPSIITATLQFSCCFFIAMAGILLLPKREYKYLTYPMYFFILGIVTQFFDFYTTPILTFGFPMLALLSIYQKENAQFSTKHMFHLSGRSFLSWLVGYISMWIGKLSLTTIFTNINALSDGFSAAQDRIFVSTGGVSGSTLYRIGVAFWRVFIRVFDKPEYILIAAACLIGVWLFLFIQRKRTKKDLYSSLPYLAISLLPLIWFAIASGPSLKHAWFQYRGIGVFLFGALLFVIQSTKKRSENIEI